jgi:hypothetical protein
MTNNNTNKPFSPSIALQWLQLIVLTIGVAGFFTVLGGKNETINRTTSDLSELKNIVQDLVKSQITFAVNDGRHQEMLDDLRIRVFDLEKRSIR